MLQHSQPGWVGRDRDMRARRHGDANPISHAPDPNLGRDGSAARPMVALPLPRPVLHREPPAGRTRCRPGRRTRRRPKPLTFRSKKSASFFPSGHRSSATVSSLSLSPPAIHPRSRCLKVLADSQWTHFQGCSWHFVAMLVKTDGVVV